MPRYVLIWRHCWDLALQRRCGVIQAPFSSQAAPWCVVGSDSAGT